MAKYSLRYIRTLSNDIYQLSSPAKAAEKYGKGEGSGVWLGLESTSDTTDWFWNGDLDKPEGAYTYWWDSNEMKYNCAEVSID